MLRINKFNVGDDPIQTLNDRISEILKDFENKGASLVQEVLNDTAAAHEGFKTGTVRHCKKCDKNKPKADFEDLSIPSGKRRYCKSCTKPPAARIKRTISKPVKDEKRCPTCKKIFPRAEFVDKSTKSGKRSLCAKCKKISNRKKAARSRAYHNW
jgi:hypothetical protein